MQWLIDLFAQGSVAQTILMLCLISIVGLALGRIRIAGMQLGGCFVFFAAIAAGHFAKRAGIEVNASMMDFAKNFGLVIFVYTLGLQCGPGFFASMRKGGLKVAASTFGAVLLSTILSVVIALAIGMPIPEMMGLLAGSTTSTPALIASQQTVLDLDPSAADMANTVSAAYAVAYPFSVLTVILCVVAMRRFYPDSVAGASGKAGDLYTAATEAGVRNPELNGKSVSEIVAMSGSHFVISRLWRDGQVEIPMSDTVLRTGDRILIICGKNDIHTIDRFFGEEESTDWNRPDIDWNIVDHNLVSKHLRVTRDDVVGQSLGRLKLRNKFSINITRINRAGITIVPDANTTLQFGDRLTVVGGEKMVKAMGKYIGNEEGTLNEPRLIPLLAGIFLGVLLGSIPFVIPGMSARVKLGLAGGPIVMGILMGAFGPKLHITTYTTRAANLMLRQMGITFFYASLGFSVGGDFLETVFCAQGLRWACLSVVLAAAPILIMSLVNDKILHLDFARNAGSLCGAATNPNALAYTNSILGNDNPAAAYATAYPLVVFLRVFLAQLVIIVFL